MSNILVRVAYIIAEGMSMALIITAFIQFFSQLPEQFQSVPGMLFIGLFVLIAANEMRVRGKKNES